jgi:hypothetical protein
MDELKPVEMIIRLHFATTDEGAIATKAEALRPLVRCVDCTLKDKCPIRKNFAFMDDDDFWCAFGAEEGAPWEDNGGDNNEDTKL